MAGRRSLAGPLALVAAASAAAVLGLWLIGQPARPAARAKLQEKLAGFGRQTASGPVSNTFKKTESEAAFDLEVAWKDFKNAPWTVRYAIAKSDLAAAETEFGYAEAELEAQLRQPVEDLRRESLASLRVFVQAEIARSRYGRYISLVEKGPLAFDLNLVAPPEADREAARKEFRRVAGAMAEEQARQLKDMDKKLERLKAEFLAVRGIRLKDGVMSVDYGSCVTRNRPRVRSALEAVRGAAPDLRLPEFLGLLLAHIQQIPYLNPPPTEGEKVILDFWVPPRVLVENGGDCDSKGITLTALWKNFRNSPLIIFKVPRHLFLAVAIPSPRGEGTVTVGGLRYTLCEVTGQELLPPGYLSSYSQMYLESGQYSYERLD